MISPRLSTLLTALLITAQSAFAEPTPQLLGAAHTAKTLCSGVFVSLRAYDEVILNDINSERVPGVQVTVNSSAKSVTVRVADATATALYRECCGCTLLSDISEEDLRNQPMGNHEAPTPLPADRPWPLGEPTTLDALPTSYDKAQLDKALDYAFDEPYDDKQRGTRGIAVVHKGRLIAERYAPDYNYQTRLLSWSMTKTITNALLGMLVKENKLDIYAPAPVPEWRNSDDPRHAITIDQLMRMSSGLQFSEEYGLIASDVVIMLFVEADSAAFTASKPLEVDPDEKWYYSSGTTNILSRIVRDTIDGPLEDYIAFPRTALFDKIGMHSAIIETDASGTLVSSSFMYATPRDWARFGLLMLQDGVWQGERLLPKGWMKYSTTPTPKAPLGQYGAQIWLNAGDPDDASNRRWPDVPADAYWCSGFEGQTVAVIPSRDAVIVRMGRTPDGTAWDKNHFLAQVLEALPKEK